MLGRPSREELLNQLRGQEVTQRYDVGELVLILCEAHQVYSSMSPEELETLITGLRKTSERRAPMPDVFNSQVAAGLVLDRRLDAWDLLASAPLLGHLQLSPNKPCV